MGRKKGGGFGDGSSPAVVAWLGTALDASWLLQQVT
jgi:hypothetical protein